MSDAFRDLFCVAQRSAVPVAPFDRLAHWMSPARALVEGGHAYADAPVFVPAGYFYQLSASAPKADEIDQSLAAAREHGAAYVMYPCVRHDADRGALVGRGFQPFPWFIESSCLRSGDLEAQMRAQLGSDRFRQIRRSLRRYHDDYETEIVVGQAAAALVHEFDQLHQRNLEKYGHRVNFYERAVLDRMFASSLGDNTFLFFSRDRRTATRVQGLLGLLDHAKQRVQLLVAGIDRSAVRPGHNVYLSAIFALYAWGEANGFSLFDLGRGKQLDKVRLGANRFRLLFNYVRGVDRPLHEDLVVVQEAARRKAEADLRDLAAVMQEGYAFPTSCA